MIWSLSSLRESRVGLALLQRAPPSHASARLCRAPSTSAHALRAPSSLRPAQSPNAANFNSLANQNDGTCRFNINGCTESTAFNYNIYANVDDGTCYGAVYGCASAGAINYNSIATVSDGSCVYS